VHWRFAPEELIPYREYNRERDPKYIEDPTLSAIKLTLPQEGYNKEYPVIISIGRNGKALLVEGNHRLAAVDMLNREAEAMGEMKPFDKIPVLFTFSRVA
jgi:hypothetical protein